MDELKVENKAEDMAVLFWFANTGDFTPSQLYSWVQDIDSETVDFPEGVSAYEANKHTWACNAADELSSLKHAFMAAIQCGAKQEEDPDTISLKWCVDDVLGQMEGRDETLSRDQAREILAIIDHQHDAGKSVGWDVIDCHIGMYLDNLNAVGMPEKCVETFSLYQSDVWESNDSMVGLGMFTSLEKALAYAKEEDVYHAECVVSVYENEMNSENRTKVYAHKGLI